MTRPIARRRAAALFDLTAGFVYAQVLSACVRLDVLRRLQDGPRTALALSNELALSESATTTLLKAAVALGLLTRRGFDDEGRPRYGLGMDGAALLGNPGALAMIAHHDRFYADMSDPVALLRGEVATTLAGFWPYATGSADASGTDVAGYTRLMSASQALVTEDILDAYDFVRHRHLLDLGGGDGTFMAAVLARAPSLRGTVLDLAPVAAQATERFAAQGLSDRAGAIGCDIWHDALPHDADIISLVRVLHDHDDARVATLLSRCFDALAPKSTLVIAEPMVAGAETRRVGDAYFGFYLLAMGSGRARTVEEYRDALHRAGFRDTRSIAMRRPLLCSMVVARR